MLFRSVKETTAARDYLLVAVVFLNVALISPTIGHADFTDGLAAYDAGRYVEAAQQWEPLALAGDSDAQVAMAGLLERGEGVGRDLGKARDLYRQAAQTGNAVGQINLADFLERGIGGDAALVEALVWYGIAARQGHRWASAQYERLQARSGTVVLQAAENLLQDYLRDFPALR